MDKVQKPSNSEYYTPSSEPFGIYEYSLCGRLSGHQSRSASYVEEDNILPQPGIEPRLLGRPARSLIATPTVEKKYTGNVLILSRIRGMRDE
jgi:hypothetical protein